MLRPIVPYTACMKTIVVIAHDLRSAHNVGSLLRTADCFGVDTVYLTGYTPYPQTASDTRLPHIAGKLHAQIHKTALGAEASLTWQHRPALEPLLVELQADGFTVAALEQTPESVDISSWVAPDKIAIVLGREVEGVDARILAVCNYALEIPQFGQKESLNVVQAAAVALYHARCITP